VVINRLNRAFVIIALTVSLVALTAGSSSGQGKSVRVAVMDSTPTVCPADRGEPCGDELSLQILSYVADKEQWHLTIVRTSIRDGFEGLNRGDVDLLAVVPYSRQLAAQYNFSQETVLSSWAQIYTIGDSAVKSLLDLDGMTIGVHREDPYNRELRSTLRGLGIACQFVELNSYDEIGSALDRKWISAGVIDRLFALAHEKAHPKIKKTDLILSPVEYRYVVSKDRNDALLQALDYHLALLKKDPRSLYYRYMQTLSGMTVESKLPVYITWGLAVAMALLLLSAAVTLLLRWQVKVKTMELRRKNIELEQEVLMRRQAEDTLSRQKVHLSDLHETSLELISRMKIEDLLEKIISRAGNLVNTKDGFIYLCDKQKGTLKMEVAVGCFSSQGGALVPYGLGLVGQVAQTGRPIILENYSTWPHRLPEADYDALHAVMAVPLHYEGDMQGVIGLGRFGDAGTFSPDEFDVLNRFAQLAAIALHNARLYAKLEEELDQRVLAERALEQSEERYRLVFENTGTATVIVEEDMKISMANSEFERMTHYRKEEIENVAVWTSLILEEDRGKLQFHPDGRSGESPVTECEVRALDRQGRVKDMVMKTGFIPGSRQRIVSLLDVTERKKLESELRQAQKMDAIGRLAGGIAHDFNNLLAPIIGHAEMSLMEVSGSAPVPGRMEKILAAGRRAKDLINQILTFSRKNEKKLVAVEMGHQVGEILKLLRASIPVTIEIVSRMPDEPFVVVADPTEVQQIVMNLCTNAAHAMRERGGRLDVCLEPVWMTPDVKERNPGLAPGSYVRLTVSDTGHGMDASVLDKIFEPFFTTKEREQGTGMGLSIVHGIVRRLHGAVEVHSEPGKGTTFHVYLPGMADRFIASTDAADAALYKGCNEKILIVDDEKPIADMANEMLSVLGYRTVATTNSVKALEIFRSQSVPFDLVITDHQMPGVDGIKLAQQLLTVRADVPVILSTGFCDLEIEKKAKAAGIRNIIRKPYLMGDLARTVRTVMGPSAVI